MMEFVGLAIGGIAAICLARWSSRDRGDAPGRTDAERFSGYLFLAALIYVGFSWGEESDWVQVEWLGALVFGAWAWLGRTRVRWLAMGWMLHVAWDLFVHGPHTPFVPNWYRWACAGFDAGVAWWLIYRVPAGGVGRLSE